MLNQTFCISTKIDAQTATNLYSWKNEFFHLWFIFSWQGGWLKKSKWTKPKPCIDKSKTKTALHSWQRLRWGGKTNKNASLQFQCLGPTLLLKETFQAKVKPADTSAKSIVSHCRTENPGSIFSQWVLCIHTLIQLANTVHFSTNVSPCSYLDAADLLQIQHLALYPQFHERRLPTLR